MFVRRVEGQLLTMSEIPKANAVSSNMEVAPAPPASATNKTDSKKRPVPGASPPSVKRRPYRRTKRPKDYNDKSTVTTTTPTLANRPVNVYDAVLGECEDLLRASLEAQKLGRLKMASAYQLLLHTRLVGLGKRFDRSAIAVPGRHGRRRRRRRGTSHGYGQDDDDDDDDDDYDDDSDDGDSEEDEESLVAATPAQGQPQELAPPHASVETALATAETPVAAGAPAQSDQLPPSDKPTPSDAAAAVGGEKGDDDLPKNLPPALQQLTSILPSNLEMDTSMMEKLARFAVELHHQRTGRKKSADGLLASPLSTGISELNASQAKNNQDGTSANGDDDDDDDDDDNDDDDEDDDDTVSKKKAPKKTKKSGKNDNAKIAWTAEEQQIVEQCVAEKKPPHAIAKLLKNKTEAQVKAFLKNQAKTSKQNNTLADDLTSPGKKRGGRGRKPSTTAMNTVPNACLDAKSLLQGILKRK